MQDAKTLMEALGLTVESGGPKGKYPRATPGPARGYRYWGNVMEDKYRFGLQSQPKAELSDELIAAFKARGFQIMPAKTEAYMWLGSDFGGAVDRAKVTMATIEAVLKAA